MSKSFAAILALALLVAGTAFADQPGRGKGNAGRAGTQGTSINITIGASDQALIREYFGTALKSGRCPPGLAKKNNGCQPPGQAKKWAKGQRLPGDVVFFDLPSDLRARLDVPIGAKLVRVGLDVLLIAAGTGMVLDAIEDLARL
jgi:hypothetical protein